MAKHRGWAERQFGKGFPAKPSSSENSEQQPKQEKLCFPLDLSPAFKDFLIKNSEYFSDLVPNWEQSNFPVDPQTGKQLFPCWANKNYPPPKWIMHFLDQHPQMEREVQQEWLRQGFLQEDPVWFQELLTQDEAGIARCFLLHGNISDYCFDARVGFRPLVPFLTETLGYHKEAVLVFSLSQGLRCLSGQLPENTPNTLRQLVNRGALDITQPFIPQVCQIFDEIRKTIENTDLKWGERGIGIIFENTHLLFSSKLETLEHNYLIDTLLHWSNSPEVFKSKHCLILIAETLDEISSSLQSQGGHLVNIAIERPNQAKSRLKFLLPLVAPHSRLEEIRFASSKQAGNIKIAEYSNKLPERLQQLAHDTAGLTLTGIEELFQRADISYARTLTRSFVLSGKREILRKESVGLLEVEDPKEGIEEAIGGYEKLVQRIRDVIYTFRHASDEVARECCPMGILFLGPPGTGKTIAAKAIAAESGVSFAKLGDFRGMYVGESEKNLSRVITLLRSLSPVIVFIDEIDQSIGARSQQDGNSVDKRLFAKLLEFISDTQNRGKILWIAASNYPSGIDEAMKRPGRFDLVLPFLLPEENSRSFIFQKLLDRKIPKDSWIKNGLAPEDFRILAQKTPGFSGAEIEGIIVEALRRSVLKRKVQNQVILQRQDFESILESYLPPKAKNKYITMEDEALEHVVFLDLLSEEYRTRREQLK